MNPESIAVQTIIDTQNANLVRWYAEGNVEAIATAFCGDAWQMPPNAAPLVGREAIRRFWSDAIRWGDWRFILKSQQVEVSGSMAVERGRYVLRFTAGQAAPAEMSSFEDSGNYLVHWRREADNQWRIACDAPVSERPPAAFSAQKVGAAWKRLDGARLAF